MVINVWLSLWLCNMYCWGFKIFWVYVVLCFFIVSYFFIFILVRLCYYFNYYMCFLVYFLFILLFIVLFLVLFVYFYVLGYVMISLYMILLVINEKFLVFFLIFVMFLFWKCKYYLCYFWVFGSNLRLFCEWLKVLWLFLIFFYFGFNCDLCNCFISSIWVRRF